MITLKHSRFHVKMKIRVGGGVWVLGMIGRIVAMVFNSTLNTISVISWRSVLLVEKTGGPGENHQVIASH
jgi:hypothetical protein